MPRDDLKRYIRAIHTIGQGKVMCPICEQSTVEFDMHEWMVPRSSMPVDKQDLIFTKENCVPVCHECHMDKAGDHVRFLAYLSGPVGLAAIGKWLTGLLEEHYSLPRGVLIEQKLLPMVTAMKMMSSGAELNGERLPEQGWQLAGRKPGSYRDYRAWIITRWKGQYPRWAAGRVPAEHNGYTQQKLTGFLNNGYWLDYLAGVIGCKPGDVIWMTGQLRKRQQQLKNSNLY